MSRLARSGVVLVCMVTLVSVCAGCVTGVSRPPPPNAPVAAGPGEEVPGAETGPLLRLAAGLAPAEVIPQRAGNIVGHGSYVRSPDGTKKVVEVHVACPAGCRDGIQFWLVDLTGKEFPRMLCSVQQNFEPGAVVALGEFRVVWSGDSQGGTSISRPKTAPIRKRTFGTSTFRVTGGRWKVRSSVPAE